MAVASGQVSVGMSATALNALDTDDTPGQSLTFWCSVAIAVGGSNVTWAAGAQLPANVLYSLDLQPREQVYAAAQSGTVTVHVVHQGV